MVMRESLGGDHIQKTRGVAGVFTDSGLQRSLPEPDCADSLVGDLLQGGDLGLGRILGGHLSPAGTGFLQADIWCGTGRGGHWLAPYGIKIAYTPLGVVVALTFIGLPFVVRTVQPVLEDFESELEEAAASLGATRWQTFSKVIFPALAPALLTGFALAFARAVGEYGSVIFIAGNIPMVSEITPLLIITKLEQYDYAGATALAVSMLLVSFVLLLAINALQRRAHLRKA
jgi:sulfate transport system permease protein